MNRSSPRLLDRCFLWFGFGTNTPSVRPSVLNRFVPSVRLLREFADSNSPGFRRPEILLQDVTIVSEFCSSSRFAPKPSQDQPQQQKQTVLRLADTTATTAMTMTMTMTTTTTSLAQRNLIVPSMAIGLTCGVGYFLAQEGWKNKNQLRRWWRESTEFLEESPLPWCVLVVGTKSWYPMALWWLLKEHRDRRERKRDGTKDKKERTSSRSNRSESDSTTDSNNTTDSGRDDARGMSEQAPTPKPKPSRQPTRQPPPFPPPAPSSPGSASRSAETSLFDGSFTELVPTKGTETRYFEMLVHNVSHTDLVLSLDTNDADEAVNDKDHSSDKEGPDGGRSQVRGPYCLWRPRFSTFDLYSRRVLESLHPQADIVSFPRYERSDATPRYEIVTPKPSRQVKIPTGFSLSPPSSTRNRQAPKNNATTDRTGTSNRLCIPKEEFPNLRLRGRDAPRIDKFHNSNDQLMINYAFFPLLATLLPRWHQQIASKHSSSVEVKKVVILVSGVGTPRNWTHSIAGNSTEACAELMEAFIHRLYPHVTVVRIHSETNLFRYDDNIAFAKRELRPTVDAYRDAHACGQAYPDEPKYPHDLIPKPFSADWKDSFNVTLSFADGSPARTHAIQAALRSYRPMYFHFWQLKSFWHDTKIVDDDLEVYSFEDMETVPAIGVNDVSDKGAQLVIEEMKNFRTDFLRLLEGRNDIRQFWLRKTKKPVLAVLLVQPPGPNTAPILYRGTNMEVSMPTGSLCAERNVIGTALASNPGLRREDLKMVAVLAVPLPSAEERSTMSRSMSMASYSSVVMEDNDTEDWILPTGDTTMEQARSKQPHNKLPSQPQSKPQPITNLVTLRKPNSSPDRYAPVPDYGVAEGGPTPPVPPLYPGSSPPGTPVRRISLYSQQKPSTDSQQPTMRKSKRTLLVHHRHGDINPLRPCGACNEWLKKIAESNPYFKVVTFTDADCNGVYCSPCQE